MTQPHVERRQQQIPWPARLERRAANRRQRALRWFGQHAITIGMIHLGFGVLGLIIGTWAGSRPSWPAPIVFILTSIGALLAVCHALIRPARQTRLAAVLGGLAVAVLRGTSYLIDGGNGGYVFAAAVGAYLMVAGYAIMVIAQSFGETLGGRHGRWHG